MKPAQLEKYLEQPDETHPWPIVRLDLPALVGVKGWEKPQVYEGYLKDFGRWPACGYAQGKPGFQHHWDVEVHIAQGISIRVTLTDAADVITVTNAPVPA
jgi:hypothetical protein